VKVKSWVYLPLPSWMTPPRAVRVPLATVTVEAPESVITLPSTTKFSSLTGCWSTSCAVRVNVAEVESSFTVTVGTSPGRISPASGVESKVTVTLAGVGSVSTPPLAVPPSSLTVYVNVVVPNQSGFPTNSTRSFAVASAQDTV